MVARQVRERPGFHRPQKLGGIQTVVNSDSASLRRLFAFLKVNERYRDFCDRSLRFFANHPLYKLDWEISEWHSRFASQVSQISTSATIRMSRTL